MKTCLKKFPILFFSLILYSCGKNSGNEHILPEPPKKESPGETPIDKIPVVEEDQDEKPNSAEDLNQEETTILNFENITLSIKENEEITISLIDQNSFPVTCQTWDTLPFGLYLSEKCILSGTPTYSLANANYQFIVKNDDQKETFVNIEIEIYRTNHIKKTIIAYKDIENNIDNLYADYYEECSITPELPEGLKLEKNCKIVGKTNNLHEATNYQLKYSNSLGPIITTFQLAVRPTDLHLKVEDSYQLCINSEEEITIDFPNDGAGIDHCHVQDITSNRFRVPGYDYLPIGLKMDSKTCQIKGKVNLAFNPIEMEMTVKTPFETKVFLFDFFTDKCDTPRLEAEKSIQKKTFYRDFPRNSLKFYNYSIKEIVNCSANPELPIGLNINPKTCQITGNPSENQSYKNYTITAKSTNNKEYTYDIQIETKGVFISTWNILPNNENKAILKLPLGIVDNYDFVVDWGDGIQTSFNSKNSWRLDTNQHEYNEPGSHQIKIFGQFDGIDLTNSNLGPKGLKEISEFGGLKISQFNFGVFANTENLVINAKDKLDLSLTDRISYMFENAKGFDSQINMDTSHIKFMNEVFRGAESFNQIVNFDTSSTVSMESMFEDAKSFNKKLEFDISNVKKMDFMFKNAVQFGKNSSNHLIFHNNLQIETSAEGMFENAKEIQEDLNFANKTLINTAKMFKGASKFNHQIIADFSKNINMSEMFANTDSYSQRFKFNIDSLDDMRGIYQKANITTEFIDQFLIDIASMGKVGVKISIPFELRSERSDRAVSILKDDLEWQFL